MSVLIVGAGPTGLALAHRIVRHGVTPRIIDAGPGPSRESRAIGIQARTLEILDAGVRDELLRRGQKLHRVEIFDGAEPMSEVSFEGAPTRFPFALALSQSRLEEVLIAELAARGVDVEWNVSLTGLAQDEQGVDVSLEGAEGARFDRVVGCDGVRSRTREASGIELESERDARWWLLADVRLAGQRPAHDGGHACVGAAGTLIFLPLEREGWWRVVAIGGTEPDRPEVTVDVIAGLVAERSGLDCEIVEHDWLSAFRIREHVARTYQRGRVFLAGDAAHAHSPLGGQGMNTGIQDACNLAWKLAAVEAGATPALLESYDAERRPIAAQLVARTSRGTRALYASSPWLVWLRNRALGTVTKWESVQDRIREVVEMLSVAYPSSPIVGEQQAPRRSQEDVELPDRAARKALREAAAPGERAPVEREEIAKLLEDPEHVVLLFDGPDSSGAGYDRMRSAARAARERFSVIAIVPEVAAVTKLSGVRVVVDEDGAIHDAFGAKSETLVVVRPDGYVGFRSQPIDLEALATWWRRITGWELT